MHVSFVIGTLEIARDYAWKYRPFISVYHAAINKRIPSKVYALNTIIMVIYFKRIHPIVPELSTRER
jgi:hypothetical protein